MHRLKLSLMCLFAHVASIFAHFLDQSSPFHLVLRSDDSNYDNQQLFACHEGAGIQGLCIVDPQRGANSALDTFQFNTTSHQAIPNATLGSPGVITFVMSVNDGEFTGKPQHPPMSTYLIARTVLLTTSTSIETESLGLVHDDESNVAHPQFWPGPRGTLFAFDAGNMLNMQSYLDDTVTKPNRYTFRAYYRWYVCKAPYGSHPLETLNWVMGNLPPQNPSCSKVDVVRQFV